MNMHASITLKRVERAVRAQMTSLENPGFCILCGKKADGCEPDARAYACEFCDQNGVYGAEELLMELA